MTKRLKQSVENFHKSNEHLQSIDFLKGLCAIWVIMLHSIPGGGKLNCALCMPFYAQLTIPCFMVLTGFVYAASYERSKGWWRLANLKRKWSRLILPYIPAFFLELFFIGLPDEQIIWLVSGGYQYPGSYYLILMLELVMIFPVIKYVCDKFTDTHNEWSWLKGMLIVFSFQCVYEACTYLINLNIFIYRLLVFRYVIFIYSGTVLYKYRMMAVIPWQKMRYVLPIGCVFIIMFCYVGYQPHVLFRYDTWFRSSAPTAFWVVPMIAAIIANWRRIVGVWQKRIGKYADVLIGMLSVCGKVSYHIYIVQMLWFGMVIAKFELHSLQRVSVFLVSTVVCSVVGIGYYFAEHKLREIVRLYYI